MIAETRDIKYGKGECDISYLQLYIWWIFFPNMAKNALLYLLFIYTVLGKTLKNYASIYIKGL